MVLILVTIIIIYWESHTPKHCPMLSCVRRKKKVPPVKMALAFLFVWMYLITLCGWFWLDIWGFVALWLVGEEYLSMQSRTNSSTKNKKCILISSLQFKKYFYILLSNLIFFKFLHNYVNRKMAFHTLHLVNSVSFWILSGLWDDYFR